jgi:beta-galactosidase
MKKVDHFLHMEWGGDSHARRHSETAEQVLTRAPTEGDWSETYI